MPQRKSSQAFNLQPLSDAYDIRGELAGREDARQYIAKRRSDDAPVMISVFTAPEGDQGNAISHIAADTHRLAGVRQRHLVPVLGGQWVGSDAYAVVTERIDAPTLAETLSRRDEEFSYARIALILREVNAVVEWARSQKFVHRAVTLDTVFLTPGSDHVMVTFAVRALPRTGIPGPAEDARNIARLARAMLTRSPVAPERDEQPLAELRPGLPSNVVAETDALLRLKPGQDVPDVATYISRLAMAEDLKSGELHMEQTRSTIEELQRTTRQQLETERRAHEEQIAREREEHAAQVAEQARQFARERREHEEQVADQARKFAKEREDFLRDLEREHHLLKKELEKERQTFTRELEKERQALAQQRELLAKERAAMARDREALAAERETRQREREALATDRAAHKREAAALAAQLTAHERQMNEERKRISAQIEELKHQSAEEKRRAAEELERQLRRTAEERQKIAAEMERQRRQTEEERRRLADEHARRERELQAERARELEAQRVRELEAQRAREVEAKRARVAKAETPVPPKSERTIFDTSLIAGAAAAAASKPTAPAPPKPQPPVPPTPPKPPQPPKPATVGAVGLHGTPRIPAAPGRRPRINLRSRWTAPIAGVVLLVLVGTMTLVASARRDDVPDRTALSATASRGSGPSALIVVDSMAGSVAAKRDTLTPEEIQASVAEVPRRRAQPAPERAPEPRAVTASPSPDSVTPGTVAEQREGTTRQSTRDSVRSAFDLMGVSPIPLREGNTRLDSVAPPPPPPQRDSVRRGSPPARPDSAPRRDSTATR